MIRILVSSCLLGEAVRYDGGSAWQDDERLRRWAAEGRLVPFCPEVAGRLPVPRPPAEIVDGGGEEVLGGRARVRTVEGDDVTASFLLGAVRAARTSKRGQVGLAILKDGSPSCGSSRIYDGSFAGVSRLGEGVTAALLRRVGIPVFGEWELDAAERCLRDLERKSAGRRAG